MLSRHDSRVILFCLGCCLVGLALMGGAGATPVDPALDNESGTTTVLLELDSPVPADEQTDVEGLQVASEEASGPLEAHANRTDGVSIEQSFWLSSMALATVDLETHDPTDLLSMPNVEAVHENAEVETHGGVDGTSTTDGLEAIDVPGAWEDHDTTGENATVAVIDTGIDVDSHDDLELASDGWAHFDWAGNETGEDPHDDDPGGHGTHVSGTVAGDRLGADGDHYGVAPDTDLLHAGVSEDEQISVAAMLAGMEWAIEHPADVDVVTVSLGTGYNHNLIEPIENARGLGVVVTASAGNDGEGTSSAPANVPGAIAVGASDGPEEVAAFSSGESIDTASVWGEDAPLYWPRNYTVPDVVAPGVQVCSAVPGGEYDCSFSGTSMAAPHVAGVAALAADSWGELDPGTFEVALTEAAEHPGDGHDTRFGHGLVNASGTLAVDPGTVEGTVTDAVTGEPLEEATIETDDGFMAHSDENGSFTRATAPDTTTVSVERLGYEPHEATLETESGDRVSMNASLEPRDVDATVRAQPADVEPGETTTASLAVANASTVSVDPVGVEEDSLSISVDGESVTPGEPHDFDAPLTEEWVDLEIATSEDTFGTLEATVELTGGNETSSVTTAPAGVHEDPIQVGGDGPTDSVEEGLAVATPETTIAVENGTYESEPLAITEGRSLEAAAGADPVITVTGNHDEALQLGEAGSLEGVSLEADGPDTGVEIADGQATRVGNVSIEGAAVGIDVTDSVETITGSALTATDTGIAVGANASVGGIVDTTVAGQPGATGLASAGVVESLANTSVAGGDHGIVLEGPTFSVSDTDVQTAATGITIADQVVLGPTDSEVTVQNGTGIVLESGASSSLQRASIEAETGISVQSETVGIYGNDLSNSSTAIAADVEEVVAEMNYYGSEPRATAGTLTGNVTYGPFVTDGDEVGAPPEQVESFGYHLTVDGPNQAVSFPTDQNRTLGEAAGDTVGTIWQFDATNQTWRQADLEHTPRALETYVFSVTEETTVTVEPANTATNRSLSAGWNLVGSPAYTDLESGFGALETATVAVDRFDAPAETPATHGGMTVDSWSQAVLGTSEDSPAVSPHSGFYLHATGADSLEPVAATTAGDYVDALGADSLASTAETAES